MATLFILSHAPHSDPFDARTLELTREGDGVLFIEDGVYAVGATSTALSPALEAARSRGVSCYALQADVQARGVQPQCPTVDYAGWVKLLEQYDRAVH